MIAFREATEADAKAITAIWNQSFPPLTVAQYRAQHDHTAAVAVEDGALIGAIPFQLRPLRLVPGVAATVAWAHSVSTIPGRRNQGLGSGMMAAARRFLAARCEAMCVYTDGGGRESSPYQFYRRAGHVDACHVHRYYQAPRQAAAIADIRHGDVREITRHEPALRALFQSAFDCYGGYWPRSPGFYRAALGSVIYIQDPVTPGVLLSGAGENPDGYAVLGDAGTELQVLELATRGGDLAVAERLLRHVVFLASGLAQTARFDVAGQHPYAGVARALGWETTGHSASYLVTAAQVLQPRPLAARLCREPALLDKVELWARVARRAPLLLSPPGARQRTRVTIELREEQFHLLLLGRLNFEEALATGDVVMRGGSAALRSAVARAFPWSPWAYHALEFI